MNVFKKHRSFILRTMPKVWNCDRPFSKEKTKAWVIFELSQASRAKVSRPYLEETLALGWVKGAENEDVLVIRHVTSPNIWILLN